MDFKIQFNRHDIALCKGRLIEELAELRKEEIKNVKKSHIKEISHQIIGTDLKNVMKDIVYKNEHGLGILEHAETQCETEPLKHYTDSECQTDEVKIFDPNDPTLFNITADPSGVRTTSQLRHSKTSGLKQSTESKRINSNLKMGITNRDSNQFSSNRHNRKSSL